MSTNAWVAFSFNLMSTNIIRLSHAFASFGVASGCSPTWPRSVFNNCTTPMQIRCDDSSSLLDSNKLELKELIFFGLYSVFSWILTYNAFNKCISRMWGLDNDLSLLERDLLELKGFGFTLLVSNSKKVVRALSVSFCCGHSNIRFFPPHKIHLSDFRMYPLDPCLVGTPFSFKPFHLEAFEDPFFDE